MPGSPATSTTPPWPPTAASRSAVSAASSPARPTNGVVTGPPPSPTLLSRSLRTNLETRPVRRLQAQGRDVLTVRRGPDVPAGGRDHPGLHHRQGPRPCRQPDGHRCPADRIRPADDGHHPGALPACHPEGDRGGCSHRRHEPPRVLLPHGHPAGAARRDHRRYPRLHHHLEQLHPAAVRLELAGELHAAARRAAVLLAVLAGHSAGPRVHLALDAARAGVLRRLPAPDRRGSHRRGEGLGTGTVIVGGPAAVACAYKSTRKDYRIAPRSH